MKASSSALPQQLTELLSAAKRFPAIERLMLARLLLDSVLKEETRDEADWLNMSLESFQKDWDNPEDAIYDKWRELYNVPKR